MTHSTLLIELPCSGEARQYLPGLRPGQEDEISTCYQPCRLQEPRWRRENRCELRETSFERQNLKARRFPVFATRNSCLETVIAPPATLFAPLTLRADLRSMLHCATLRRQRAHCYCTGILLPLDNTDLRCLMATHITVNCPQYKQRRIAFNYFGIIFHYLKKTKKQGAWRPASPPRQVTRPAPRKYAAAQRCHLS